ncbi:putative MFS general substrate transporter [Rosellinia necatrix]|uniref:Putative MFS general substrate transporter n=1 Tax=Rosellinia necatrix TaxID=77044 RepID=A0A1W2TFW8_ROSNE|nr:putative MFS general substrate transporter [Rosellinia necatrix]
MSEQESDQKLSNAGAEEMESVGKEDVRTPEEFDKKLERRVLWKLDTRILPILAVLFLCSFFDRTNVGNARLYGLEADIGITNHQYNIGLAVFYATYIFGEIPSNLILKKVTPSVWLPCLAFFWGVIAMSTGFIKTFPHFVAIRALLGLCEGGLLPGMILYLSGTYRRTELAIRIGIFYTSASLSGAFSGLLARAISELDGRAGLEAWRWIFIIFGLFTISVGFTSFWLLPNNVASARFFTPEERDCAIRRLHSQGASTTGREREETERFAWSEVARGVFSWQTWLSASAYFGILSGLYSFGLFLPTIIRDMGYTANEAQLWSVIPYAVAAVATLCTAYLSDRLHVRGLIMLCSLPIAITGYAVIANVHIVKVKYGMTFLMATGLYSSVPPVLGWLSNNSAGHYKRATTSALQLAIANAGGFVAVFIYPKDQGPQYHNGHTIVLGLLTGGWFLVLCNVLYCWKVNRDKANGKYDQYAGYGDDRDPTFKMVL